MSQSNYALGAPDNSAQRQQIHDKLDTLVVNQSSSNNYPVYYQLGHNADYMDDLSTRANVANLGSGTNSEYHTSFEDDYCEAPYFAANSSGNLWSLTAPLEGEQDYLISNQDDPEIYREPRQQMMPTEPWVEIIEQPAHWAPKFRYMNERPTGRFPGCILGVNSTSDNKTYPTIRINNIRGAARVVVSCVTAQEPYRVHPHGMWARHNCAKDVYTIHLDESLIDPSTNSITKEFQDLGIECARRRDIKESLKRREDNMVDPFSQGYTHREDISSIDLNVIRLCFQVFVQASERDLFKVPLKACVTEPIRNVKIKSKLVICRLSHPAVEASGGTEIILLTEKIDPNDIQVRFYEERGGQVVWESLVDITPDDVHEKSAICLSTPRYCDGYVYRNVNAQIQLVRKCDGQVSEPREIIFYAFQSDTRSCEHKKRKLEAILNAPQGLQPPPEDHYQAYLYSDPNYSMPDQHNPSDPFLAGPSHYNY